MKRILVVLFSSICFIGYAQTPYPTPYTQQGSPSTLVQVRGGWKADSTAMMPKYVDTITANLYKTKLYAGSIIFTTGDGNYWYRSADAARWLLFGNSVTNCLGTQLISGSITWSGSGLIFDATDLDYSIICTRYSSSATTLTLSTADPTYARIDKLYADITGNVGVITGTPAPNPQEPVINPLSQLDMGIVYIPAGSTVPAGTTQTVIYNENVEWTGTSDVPSIDFAYATNPYIGSLSTYIPSAPNSSYVEWQSGGIDYLFSDAQYLKFWVRLNANFVSDPLSFLDVTFEYTDVTVSQTLAVGNGDYNMDYSLINQWQLVSIPLTGITTYGTEFNSVHFVINSAPTSFQLDYIYLLETATVPPAPVGGTWLLNGNSAINDATQYIGTRDAKKLNFGTNGQIRAYIDTAGIEILDDTTANVMLIDSNGKIWKTYQPTILADAPLYIYTDSNNKKHIADTSGSSGGNCGLVTGGEVTLIDTTTFNVSAALYCIGNVNYSSLDSVITLTTPGDTVRIDVIGVDTSGSVFKLTGVESVNPSPPSVDATYQLILSFVLVSTDSITPYNPQLSWNTNGNSNTNPFVNFLGTNDNKGFMIKTNNNRSGFIDRVLFSSSWGIEALNTNAGSNNNAMGYGAGFLNSTGSDNNYLGNAAGYANTTGIRNTAIGGVSNYANTSGSENVSVGYRSLQNNQASGIVSIGFEALQSNTSGIENTAVGYQALNANTDGTKNTAIGSKSLISNTTGDDNVAISYFALRRNTTGNANVAIGLASLTGNETGNQNVSIGSNSGVDISNGSLNTLVGTNSNTSLSSTDSSGAFGAEATASTRQMAFSPYFNTMFLDLDSASGTAPAIAGIDENGNWRKYATPAGGSSQWTDTTAGIYYADKVGIGGVMNPDSTLVVVGSATVSNSLIVGTSISNSGIGSIVSGINNTVGTGMNNIVVGVGHNVANNQGANSVFGEVQTMGNSEASTIINGFGNIVGDGANDALVGGTGSSTFASSTIAIGLGNETNAVESISIGGGGNAANGIYSGTFAGTSHEAEDSAAVAIGGQNNSVGGVNAAILGGENNFTSGRNTVVLGGSGINGTMANTVYLDTLRVGGKIVAPNLPTSGTYSKSLAIDASGNIYKKDTLAVSGVYLPIASPTFTGPLTSISGAISIGGNINAFNISAAGLLRSAAASRIEHNGRNQFNAVSDGFETLTANSGAANTANLSVGSLRTGYVAKTANYTATAFDETISCSTNAFTITLPTAVGCAGQKYNITNSTAANTITIGTTSSQTFANVTATPTTLSLVGLGAVIVVSDGANWLQLK